MKNTNNKKIGILGCGEVGQAIARFYTKPMIRDSKHNAFTAPLDVLNVCIPESRDFIHIVSQNIRDYSPKLVIIHSTVYPGRTLELYKRFGNVVHSPIRGMHPDLYEGVKVFVKYIGCDDMTLGRSAERHFKEIGIRKVKIFTPSMTTELGKLFDTTYYGLCIAYHAFKKKICEKSGVNFEDAVTRFNKTYNDGYKKLGKENVVRPVLYAPKNDKIGGHCVIPNAKILKEYFGDDEILKSILRHE